MSDIAIPSCPAPLARKRGSMPSARICSAICSMIHGAHGLACASCCGVTTALTLRRTAMASISHNTSATAALRIASSPARMSMVNSATPGITLVAPLGTLSTPTVPTSDSMPWQRFSIKSSISAAAVAASWRWSIGTVPACPACPSTRTTKRFAPAIEVTTPTGRPSFSNTGPCSIWIST